MCNKDSKECLGELLKNINILQQNATCDDVCLDSCDRGFLGCSATTLGCNTRPVIIYCGCSNMAWAMPTTKTAERDAVTSIVFRVEKIDGDCCTFRVLAPNNENDSNLPYVATNSFFTMDIKCLCSVRCLPDTFIECI